MAKWRRENAQKNQIAWCASTVQGAACVKIEIFAFNRTLSPITCKKTMIVNTAKYFDSCFGVTNALFPTDAKLYRYTVQDTARGDEITSIFDVAQWECHTEMWNRKLEFHLPSNLHTHTHTQTGAVTFTFTHWFTATTYMLAKARSLALPFLENLQIENICAGECEAKRGATKVTWRESNIVTHHYQIPH